MSFKSTQRQVSITVKKAQRGWWDRLTIQEKKPLFLAPDFDRWLEESDAEMEIHEKVNIKAVFCLRGTIVLTPCVWAHKGIVKYWH